MTDLGATSGYAEKLKTFKFLKFDLKNLKLHVAFGGEKVEIK